MDVYTQNTNSTISRKFQGKKQQQKTSRKTKPSFRTIPQPPLDFMVIILLYCDIGVFFLPSPKIQTTPASHLWIIQSEKMKENLLRGKKMGVNKFSGKIISPSSPLPMFITSLTWTMHFAFLYVSQHPPCCPTPISVWSFGL